LFLFFLPHRLRAQAQEKEKIAEGQYATLRDNLRIQGSEQNWILWRLPSGRYELEDHFQPHADLMDQLLLGLPSSKLSPELRKEKESKVNPTDLLVRYGSDHRAQTLIVSGKRLVDGKAVDIVNCEVSTKEVRCRGREQSAKLRLEESDEFFYAFPFPMLLSVWFASSTAPSAELLPAKVAVLDFGDKLDLTQADRRIESLQDETLTIGDRQFQAHKANVTLAYKDRKPLRLTIWYGARGLVYALATEGINGERMSLVQYKRYSDF
jgi:hypothetical protein